MDILVGAFHDRLQVLHFSPSSASLSCSSVSGESAPATEYNWLAAVPKQPARFYGAQAADERFKGNGSVSLLELKKSSGEYSVEVLQVVHSGGQDPCHVGITPDGTELAIANYDSSTVATYKLDSKSGSIDTRSYKQFNLVSLGDFQPGPDQPRQDAPHPHGCFYNAASKQWLVPDLGSDKLRIVDGQQGQVAATPSTSGSGPRHAVAHPQGRYVYAVNELANTISVHDTSSPTQLPIATLSVLATGSEAIKGLNAAAILLSKDARSVYVTNRLEGHWDGDALVWFSVSEDGSQLSRKGELRVGLDHPRAAQLLEVDGKEYLITGSKTQTGAVIYERNPATGDLAEVARNGDVVHASCFLPLAL